MLWDIGTLVRGCGWSVWGPVVTSIVLAAHYEAAVVGRCLDAVLAGAASGEFDVTVVANGCTDATARVAAARPGVRVLELPGVGKVAALNAGDAVAVGYPRVYLDADIVIPAAGVRAALAAAGSTYGAGRGAAGTSWLRDVALRDPALIPAAACYAAITLTAAVFARFPQRPGIWGRDDSSRQDDRDAGSMGAADGRR